MNIRKILVIKLRHLGDVLLSSPVYGVLRRAYPEAIIDAYVWKEAAPMLEGHPAIQKIHVYDRKWKDQGLFARGAKELQLLHTLRRERYDLVINLTEGDRGGHVALVSGAHTKVGVRPKKRHMEKVFTHLVQPAKTPRHAVERDLDALRVLGIHPEPKERELFFQPADRVEGVPEGEFAVMHGTARWKFKCPPPSIMAKVVDLLDVPVVLTGAPSEVAYVGEIERLATKPVVNMAGKTSLKEMGSLLKRSQGVITVDSVSLHMASALKVPTVAIFGPTSDVNWGPWRNPHAHIIAQKRGCRPCQMAGCGGSKMSDCLYTLSPEAIAKAYQEVALDAAAGGGAETSASSLLVLNSFEI